MPANSARRNGSGGDGIAALGIAVVAVGCCAGVPLVAALASSVAVGALLGVGAGIVFAITARHPRSDGRRGDPARADPAAVGRCAEATASESADV